MPLLSPGVQVTVTDESFFASSEAGSTPLIVVATKENKTDPSGTAIASGTTQANANTPILVSSQRELLQTFGNPIFHQINGTPLHGYELNEYGLLAAHSFLGITNRAYVLRADLDLEQLEPVSEAPSDPLPVGSYWFDTDETDYGVFQWNSTTLEWEHQEVIVINDLADTEGGDGFTPDGSIGQPGDFASVTILSVANYNPNQIWWKDASGDWVEVGTDAWEANENLFSQYAPHYNIPEARFGTGATIDRVWGELTDIIDDGSVTILTGFTSNFWQPDQTHVVTLTGGNFGGGGSAGEVTVDVDSLGVIDSITITDFGKYQEKPSAAEILADIIGVMGTGVDGLGLDLSLELRDRFPLGVIDIIPAGGGTGYLPISTTTTVSLVTSAGTADVPATVDVTVDGSGVVTNVEIVSAGTYVGALPTEGEMVGDINTAMVTGGPGGGLNLDEATIPTGVTFVDSVNIDTAGTLYDNGTYNDIALTDGTNVGGDIATVTFDVVDGEMDSIVVTNPGTYDLNDGPTDPELLILAEATVNLAGTGLDATNFADTVMTLTELDVNTAGAGYSAGITFNLSDSTGASASLTVGDFSSVDFLDVDGVITADPLLIGTVYTQFTGVVTATVTDGLVDGDLWIKTTIPNNGANWVIRYLSPDSGLWELVNDGDGVPLFSTRGAALSNNVLDVSGHLGEAASLRSEGDIILSYELDNGLGNVITPDQHDVSISQRFDHKLLRWNGLDENTVTGTVGTVGTPALSTGLSTSGTVLVNGTSVSLTAGMELVGAGNAIEAFNTALFSTNIEAFEVNGKIQFVNTDSTDLVFITDEVDILTELGLINNDLRDIDAINTFFDQDEIGGNLVTGYSVYSNWEQLSYTATATTPTIDPADDTLWYSEDLKVDILVSDGLGEWQEFGDDIFLQSVEPTGVTVSSGDLWIDTADTENYPRIYRYNGTTWDLLDNTDQTTQDGILFGDARDSDVNGELILNAPFNLDVEARAGGIYDARFYPQGMLLFNTRYSTFNVKRFDRSHADVDVAGGRLGVWVTESGNRADGSPYMGRHAVKRVVEQRMAAALQAEELRAEGIQFNLIATPGCVGLLDEMKTLNDDRKNTAFIVGDSPMRLAPTSQAIQDWALNNNGALENGEDGLLTRDPYIGIYYPSGLSTNVDGQTVVVPSSHIALRTIAFNDQVAYPWFAPAGFQRGLVQNAQSVGYLDSEGEYVRVRLTEGQRDTLYVNSINPIADLPGRGLVVFGQKTLNPVESALDRVNVARLVNYIRLKADELAKPFLFEPNDIQTRKNVKKAFDNFLAEIRVLRGIQDFLVVVDESNNTPVRVGRCELWIDLAIVPTKSVEFIYIPIRILTQDGLEDLT